MPQITLPSELTNCSIWELAAMHDYFRRQRHFIKCSKIEIEVNNRSLLERLEIIKLRYYKPIAEMQVKMFNNT